MTGSLVGFVIFGVIWLSCRLAHPKPTGFFNADLKRIEERRGNNS